MHEKAPAVWKWLDNTMERVITPAWKWPTPWRRLYLCTLPVSLALRGAVITMLVFSMGFWFIGRSIGFWFAKIWNGQRPGLFD